MIILTQVWEGKAADEKMELIAEVKTQKSDVASEILKEHTLDELDSNDCKLSENGCVAKTGDAPKGAKPVPVVADSKIANGVANGC